MNIIQLRLTEWEMIEKVLRVATSLANCPLNIKQIFNIYTIINVYRTSEVIT
ncbi:hypothetical protein ACIN8IBEIGE_20266 [Acinetobacter sp. 8I-beige]|nr:hypothetical protein ACIN8IBEIGE_20266 [Acinetobacter sp. 8I-beige]